MTDTTKIALEQQLAIRAIEATEAATQCMIDWLDALRGDADLEDDDPAEDGDQDQCLAADDDPARLIGDGRPGDAVDGEDDDPGGCEHDGREPDHDAELQTWSHWMDHPAELHIGERPGHTRSGGA